MNTAWTSQHALEAELIRLRAEVATLRRELAQARQFGAAGAHEEPTPRARETTAPVLRHGARRAITEDQFARVDPAPPATFPIAPRGPSFVMPADQGIDFGAVSKLSPEELDSLPYGLITLDAKGRVIHYNDTESRMVGLPKESVLGRSFFGDIAPCTRVREFQGRFEALVKDPLRVRVQTFDFVFRFANGEQQVTIVMTPARLRGQYNLALLRRQASG
jgi:photoactive yellow protein